jgi:hypothetical protein
MRLPHVLSELLRLMMCLLALASAAYCFLLAPASALVTVPLVGLIALYATGKLRWAERA